MDGRSERSHRPPSESRAAAPERHVFASLTAPALLVLVSRFRRVWSGEEAQICRAVLRSLSWAHNESRPSLRRLLRGYRSHTDEQRQARVTTARTGRGVRTDKRPASAVAGSYGHPIHPILVT